jgi:hypothetical protein
MPPAPQRGLDLIRPEFRARGERHLWAAIIVPTSTSKRIRPFLDGGRQSGSNPIAVEPGLCITKCLKTGFPVTSGSGSR